MLFVESEKIYSLKKRHGSDTLAHCARRALKACKQGDGILCETSVEISTVKRAAHKREIPIAMRKQNKGGWILYPILYKCPKYKAYFDKKREELKRIKNEKQSETSTKN